MLGGTGPTASAAPVSWTFLPAGPPTTVNGQPAIRQRVRIQFSNLGDGDTALDADPGDGPHGRRNDDALLHRSRAWRR